MAARSFVLGIDCEMYRMPNASRGAGDPALPRNPFAKADYTSTHETVWKELQTIRDVTLNMTASTADVTSRKSNGWRQTVSVLKEASIDFSVLWQPGDDLFDELLNQFMLQCPAAFLVLDGPLKWAYATPSAPRCGITGDVTGLFGDFCVTSFTRNETLEEGVTADVTLEPSLGLIYPEWISLPVYTAP